MPARDEQIGQRTGDEQAMGVLFEPAIALRRALRPMPDGRLSTRRPPHSDSSPLKRAGAYPTTTGIRHLAEVLTEPGLGGRDWIAPPVRVLFKRWSPSTCNLAVTFAGVWPDIPPGEA